MSDHLDCDVLIVGGGPAGLSVAATLPDHVRSIVVHQDRAIGLPVRTSGGCWLSDAERLGIPAHLYQRVDTVDIFSDSVQAQFAMTLEQPVILDITGLYRWIAAQSEAKSRTLLLATKFLTAQRQGTGWQAQVRSRDTPVTQITARYIVDASGVHCAVLAALGLAKRPARTGIGIEHEYPIGRNDPHRGLLFVGRDALAGYGWAFPTTDGRLRLGIGVINPDTDASPRALLDRFVATGAPARMGLHIDGAPLSVNAGTLPSVPYDPRLVFGSVIRVGDAANFATPTVGEGIRICMDLGRLLGTALGDTLATGGDRPLRRYERISNKRLSRNYRLGYVANTRIARYTPADWDRSVRRLSRLSQHQLVALLRSEFTLALALATLWRSLRSRLQRRLGADPGAPE